MFDADKDGVVSFSEFMITVFLQGRKDPEEKLRLVFCMYDHNCNGFIEKKEIEAILQSIADFCDQIEFEELNDWDVNNAGQLNEQEFVNFIMNKPKLKKFFLDLIKLYE